MKINENNNVNCGMKEIPGFNGYFACEDGRIFNTKTNIYLKPYQDSTGYQIVALSIPGKGAKSIRVHRLIMMAFTPNPENKRCVNHINGIKSDNRLVNLEWVTDLENMQHAYNTGLHSRSIPKNRELARNRFSKKVINTITGKIYDSMKIAAKELGVSYDNACKQCRNPTQKSKIKLQYHEK
jgi:hypothetical protein